MIRFCNQNICHVLCENLNKEELLDYFSHNCMNEVLYIIDTLGKYRGRIVYESLISCTNVYDVIEEEYVILDKDIWNNAKHYFAYYSYERHKHVLLPVVDKSGQLICFAYEDEEANREIRMLRELLDTPGALQFSDIYPKYKYVKIFEFNELAYFFAKYLEMQNIPVLISGVLWQDFYAQTENQVPDYECLTIYAEGVKNKKSSWKENLLRSVSVEFECIDEIYEINVRKGIIQDAKGDCAGFLERLKGEKELIIYGTGKEEQDAYDFLLGQGIEICCFVGMESDELSHRMFGKKIVSEIDARKNYKNPVFLDCVSQHSAWGLGKVDYYDYIGYRRNEGFFLIKDYVEIAGNSLLNILRSTRVALAGDIYLCCRLFIYLKQNNVLDVGYLSMFSQEDRRSLPSPGIDDIDKETMCLLVLPEFCTPYSRQKQDELARLKENGIDNYTDYFSYTISFIDIEESNNIKYRNKCLIPQRIIQGALGGFSGNAFFRGILDNHPSVLMISDYNYLNDALFWVCVRLSAERAENILSLFWKLHETERWCAIDNVPAFNKKMEQLLSSGNEFTSQELFVMIHIAYMSMWREDMAEIQDMVIYWEPHAVLRAVGEEWVRWLGTENVPCDIVNVVRNIYMRNGTGIKGLLKSGQEKTAYSIYLRGLTCPPLGRRKYIQSERTVIKFEDLKLNPQKILSDLCNRWNIKWSDSFMKTTCRGKLQAYNNGDRMVSDYDLKPVYHTYEEYFSSYDRFRIMLFNMPWQSVYGYSFVRLTDYSRRELQEMFLHNFRFEELIEFVEEEEELEFKIELQSIIRSDLQKKRRWEYFPEDNWYTDVMMQLDKLFFYSEAIRFRRCD